MDTADGERNVLLSMRNISKSFSGVTVVDNVNLELKAGEVLSLVGENGAGKSTLIKILSGAYKMDHGEICINGEKQAIHSPADAIKKGVTVIYQELNICGTLSIAENMYIGHIPTKFPFKMVDRAELKKRCSEIMTQLNLNYNPNTPIAKLSIAGKQIVEIAKALTHKTKVLVMDEPTAALNDQEVRLLFDIVRRVKSMGTGIIFISHRLDEIFEIADKVMIMRDGKSVHFGKTGDIDKGGIIRHMVGREIVEERLKTWKGTDEEVFRVENLSTKYVRDIGFNVCAGEIVGLFGLMGSGRTEIVKTIFGAHPKRSGDITVLGKPVHIKKPSDAKKAGIAYIPNDRKQEGLLLIKSVKDNISITVLRQILGSLGINKKTEIRLAEKWIQALNIKAKSPYQEVHNLSGGNQQKIVMAKWFAAGPKVLILNEPTRGVDVGAKREIYNIILDLCKQGLAVLMVSSDLPEILSMADRVVVIHEGRKTGEVSGEDITQKNLMTRAVGE
ncbi:MAG: sugar ABC transporter ATP-binding protein [Acidobacteriota bacterium]|jgi:ABC-type sugar transport system ATPase subunit|nr:sugar ABC transporter ATP-binding protein [Acidobacteriota bacterium]